MTDAIASDLPIRAAPEVGPGHVCLVGAGEYLPPMTAVDAALLALTPAAREGRAPVVVCLPTAAGTEGEEVVGRWMSAGIEHFRGLGADAMALRVIDRATAEEPELADVIGAADLVYLSGGKPPHLLATLRGTPAWEGVLRVLAAGGVLAGCSAGAMIMGAHVPSFPNMASRQPGFALVPDAIVLPHFDEFFGRFGRLAQLGAPAGSYLLGIDGMTGLLVGGDGWRVLGARRVVVDDGRRRVELRAGDRD
jgi:cyanophycinase-like exopeptidase